MWWAHRAHFTVAVEGRSMWPALAPGDWLVVRRRPMSRDRRAVGRVVCLRAPDGRMLVKRIAAAPGDAYPLSDTALRSDVLDNDVPDNDLSDNGVLGTDEYFVLGDCLDASTDSRQFGPVLAARIEGVARLRYWPPGRIGRVARLRAGER